MDSNPENTDWTSPPKDSAHIHRAATYTRRESSSDFPVAWTARYTRRKVRNPSKNLIVRRLVRYFPAILWSLATSLVVRVLSPISANTLNSETKARAKAYCPRDSAPSDLAMYRVMRKVRTLDTASPPRRAEVFLATVLMVFIGPSSASV